jgi:hypothetical protein
MMLLRINTTASSTAGLLMMGIGFVAAILDCVKSIENGQTASGSSNGEERRRVST